MQKPLFVTFYSYKGGVGRTLALGNVAWEAALRGKRVVVIDFDLEAPGMPKLIPFRDPVKVHLEGGFAATQGDATARFLKISLVLDDFVNQIIQLPLAT